MSGLLKFAIWFIAFSFLTACGGGGTTGDNTSYRINIPNLEDIELSSDKLRVEFTVDGKSCVVDIDNKIARCDQLDITKHSYEVEYIYTEDDKVIANGKGEFTIQKGVLNVVDISPKTTNEYDDVFKPTAVITETTEDESYEVNSPITLSAQDSTAYDGRQLSYEWQIISAIDNNQNAIDTDGLLTENSKDTLTFTPTIAGIYSIELVVNDGGYNSAPVSLDISVVNSEPPPEKQFTITIGTVDGLIGSGLKVQINGQEELNIAGAAPFEFSTKLKEGDDYNVVVNSQPTAPEQTCKVENGSDTIGNANIVLTVSCEAPPPPPEYSVEIGATVNLKGDGIKVRLNGADESTVTNNNLPVIFGSTLKEGEQFEVTIIRQPTNPDQNCTVNGAKGLIEQQDISLNIACVDTPDPVKYVLSVETINGLKGSNLILQNNGKDDLPITNSTGPFQFTTQLRENESYDITVKQQPTNPNQSCTVPNSKGVVGKQDIPFTVTCTDNNEAPLIPITEYKILENASNPTAPVEAIDAPGSILTFSIVGGADQARFSIQASTGILSINSPANYEQPSDANVDNVFDLTIRVSDGELHTDGDIKVNVIAVNEPPKITSPSVLNIDENQNLNFQVIANDPENTSLNYQLLSSPDKTFFDISSDGQLSLVNTLDFEDPQDNGRNNEYEVKVQVSDGVNKDEQTIKLTVNAVNDNLPAFTSSNTVDVLENKTEVIKVNAADADGQTVTYEIVAGTDQDLFEINATSGQLNFKNAPDYENPFNGKDNNSYEVIIEASDGTRNKEQTITVNVKDVSAVPPPISLRGKTAHEVKISDKLVLISTYSASTSISNQNDYTLQVVDISNPGVPSLKGSEDIVGEVVDMAVSGSKAYVAYDDISNSGNSGIQVINLSNPSQLCTLKNLVTPGPVGPFSDTGIITDIDVDEKVAYLTYTAGSGFSATNELQTIDITKIENSCNASTGKQSVDISDTNWELGKISLPLNTETVENIKINGTIAYISSQSSGGFEGLTLVEVKKPDAPAIINMRTIFDIESVFKTSLFDTLYTNDLFIHKDVAILSYRYSDNFENYGLKLYDISSLNPLSYTKPTESPDVGHISQYQHFYNTVRGRNGTLNWKIHVDNQVNCATLMGCELHLMFIETAWECTAADKKQRRFSIHVQGDLRFENFEICDVAKAKERAITKLVSGVRLREEFLTITLEPGTLGGDSKPEIAGFYLTDGDINFSVNIGVDDESFRTTDAPLDAADIPSPNSAPIHDVFIYGSNAYVVGDEGLQLVDISNIQSPGQFKTISEVKGDVFDVEVQDGYAYVANGESGLTVVKLSEIK